MYDIYIYIYVMHVCIYAYTQFSSAAHIKKHVDVCSGTVQGRFYFHCTSLIHYGKRVLNFVCGDRLCAILNKYLHHVYIYVCVCVCIATCCTHLAYPTQFLF